MDLHNCSGRDTILNNYGKQFYCKTKAKHNSAKSLVFHKIPKSKSSKINLNVSAAPWSRCQKKHSNPIFKENIQKRKKKNHFNMASPSHQECQTTFFYSPQSQKKSSKTYQNYFSSDLLLFFYFFPNEKKSKTKIKKMFLK